MKQRRRIYYSDSQKALMWERWKQGATLHEIGKLFDRPHTSIHNILSATGGIRPAERTRATTTLSLAEREEISRATAAGESMRSDVYKRQVLLHLAGVVKHELIDRDGILRRMAPWGR